MFTIIVVCYDWKSNSMGIQSRRISEFFENSESDIHYPKSEFEISDIRNI